MQIRLDDLSGPEIRALLDLVAEDQRASRSRTSARGERWEAAARRVPRRLIERYEFLIEGGRAPAVVPIDRGTCSGCHLRLPTMTEHRARHAQALHVCPHCRRLLYAADLLGGPPRKQG